MITKRTAYGIALLVLASMAAGCLSAPGTPTAPPVTEVTLMTTPAGLPPPETATVAAVPTSTPTPLLATSQIALQIPPLPPGNVQARREGSQDELVSISWEASAGAESYQLSLLLCAAGQQPWPLVSSVDKTSHTVQDWGDCQVPSNGEIRACNVAGCSPAVIIPWPQRVVTPTPGATPGEFFPAEKSSDQVRLSVEGGHGSTHAVGETVEACYAVQARDHFYLKGLQAPCPEASPAETTGLYYEVLEGGIFTTDISKCLDVELAAPAGCAAFQIEVWREGSLLDTAEVWIRVAAPAGLSGPAEQTPQVVPATATPTPLPAPTARATLPVPALRGRIAFPVFDAARQTYDIYLARPDGSNMQRVIEEASQPALSPNGQQLALRRWKKDERGIEVMNVTGGNPQRRTKFFEDGLPSWSPDGGTLVFFSRREKDRQVRIYAVGAASGGDWELKRGIGPVHGEYPTWMPDGRILYRVPWGEEGLAVMNSDGSGEQLIIADKTATAPAVSPDGRLIAFMSQRDGNWEIYRGNADGSAISRLTTNDGNDGLPAWSPDGRTIAFVSDRGGAWAMWAMNADGSQPRRLFALPGAADGLVRGEPDYSSRGWVEERISWGP
ncbi:MAG: hypothetical protein QHJ81_14545 [Anaerolineae bacterium]|nr:hypothetical protein [Anaerolineae bacterium]